MILTEKLSVLEVNQGSVSHSRSIIPSNSSSGVLHFTAVRPVTVMSNMTLTTFQFHPNKALIYSESELETELLTAVGGQAAPSLESQPLLNNSLRIIRMRFGLILSLNLSPLTNCRSGLDWLLLCSLNCLTLLEPATSWISGMFPTWLLSTYVLQTVLNLF